MASNSLDEYLIRDLILQGAVIDTFAVIEKPITSKSDPVFGGVYELVAVEENGKFEPPHQGQRNGREGHHAQLQKSLPPVQKDSGQAVADYVTLFDEEVPAEGPIPFLIPWRPGNARSSRTWGSGL